MRARAIVFGGNLASYCCARALSRSFREVVLVDRDDIPNGVGTRAGIPQARHAHVVLDRGRRDLEHLFPGFERRMSEQGAVVLDPGLLFATLGGNGWGQRLATGARMVCASRDLTDATVRELARVLPNVTLRARSEPSALCVEGGRVTAVEVTARDGDAREWLSADLVVDASGRATKVPALLAAAGVAAPVETVVDSGTWYATRWFRARPRHELPEHCWWKAAIVLPRLSGPGALLAPVEGDRWVVSIASIGRGQPRIDEDNFLSTLRALPSPIIAEAVGEPISPVYGSRSTPNRRYHYEQWTAPLGGFVAVGDAMMAFNPVHGQGISTTALCARLLEQHLERDSSASPAACAAFFKAQAAALAGAWSLSTGFDLRFPNTPGKRSLLPKLVAPYFKLVVGAAHEDLSLMHLLVAEIGQLNQPTSLLMAPGMVARVLGSAVRRRLRRAAPPPPPATGAYPPSTIRTA